MNHPFEKIGVLVIDGVGCGEAADTREKYPEDAGSNSLVNASHIKTLHAPGLQGIGLEHIPWLTNLKVQKNVRREDVRGAFGALEPTFAGNGSPEGHMALMGHIVSDPFLLFNRPPGFPPALVSKIEEVAAEVALREVRAIRYPGTDDISGTDFIKHPAIGARHLASKDPASGPLMLPIYASSDSLVQVAIHKDMMPQEQMEAIAKAIRDKALIGEFRNVARVILRVFAGGPEPENFERKSVEHRRRDYALDPSGQTLVDHLQAAGISRLGIGKAPDMLNKRGFEQNRVRAKESDHDRVGELFHWFADCRESGFAFTNVVYTDSKYGHRRDPVGYIDHIASLDRIVKAIRWKLTERDLLIVTSDHGTDPTQRRHTNHTRELVPLLIASGRINRPIALGIRGTYADVAATIGENFGVQDKMIEGTSMLKDLLAA